MSTPEQFINRPMSLVLDAIRGLAAVMVLVGHGVQMELYTGPWPFDMRLQHNAVVIFFVLSGLVIAHSAGRPGTDLRAYAIARAARIMPVALFAIGFSVAVASYAHATGLPDGSIPPNDRISAETTLLPLVFLSQSVPGGGLVWNPPFWSLCYEVWFYALFAAAFYLRARVRVMALALFALVAGWKILLLMPVWLIGVAMIRHQERLCLGRKAAPWALATGIAVFILANQFHPVTRDWLTRSTGLAASDFGFSIYAISDLAMGIGIALVFMGLRPFAQWHPQMLERLAQPIRFLAGCSFTLYLIHWPLLMLVRGFGIGMGANFIGFVAIMALVIACAGLLAQVVEKRSPELRRLLEARFGSRPVIA